MHSIIYDRYKKALIATLSGNIGTDQANAMLMDFKKSINGINTREHILIINQENITASIFVLPILQSFIQMVGQLNFKRIYLVNSEKYAALIKQTLSKNGSADNLSFASSVKEVLNS